MKKIAALALIMVASALGVNAQQYYGRVQDKDGYTNIRRGASTNSPIARQYQSGDYLYYTPQSNGWSKVYSGKSANTFMGYMHTSRIVKVNPNQSSSSSSATSNKRRGIIVDPVDNYVNVRKGPSTNHAIATQLTVGTTVYYEGSSKWVKVYDTNQRYLGYVYRNRIR